MHSIGAPEPRGRIDTLGFAFEIEGEYQRDGATANVVHLGEPGEAWRYSHKLPNGGFIGLGMGSKCWAEASLPKRHDGENVVALTVPDALESAREVFEEAQRFCTPTTDGARFELAKVVRLDGVRDFDNVRGIGPLLDGLASFPRGAREKVRRHQDGERNRAETVTVGPRAWHATLYDKHAETASAPEGRVRFEARMHHDQLTATRARNRGFLMRQVGDVREESVRAITRDTFERVGFNREVSAIAEVAAEVFALPTTDTKKAMLWAFLTAPGFAASLHRNTRYRYRDMAAGLGLVPGQYFDEVDESAAPLRTRLDFDMGTEVRRVA